MASNYSSESKDVFDAIERAAESGDNVISLSDGRLFLRLASGEEVKIDVEAKRWYMAPKLNRKKADKGQINKRAYKDLIDEIVAAVEARKTERDSN
jgi:hypothetical protein